MNKVNICLVGAGGRMGVEIAKVAFHDPSVEISVAVEYPGSPKIGMNFNANAGLPPSDCLISDNIMEAADKSDVIVDFSGSGTLRNINSYKELKKPLIIGSTGISHVSISYIESLSSDIPLIIASNMSLGVNVLAKFVEIAAGILNGADFDIEIFEAHHKHKKDAPSGTALTLGKAAAIGRGVDLDKVAVYAREGITGERTENSIGFSVMRGGDIAGDHTVFFCGDGERLELTHRASNRVTFAKGAVRAAKWIFGKSNGLYSINDVLGL